MKIIDANSPTFVDDLAEAIGLEPGEKLVVQTPVFEREDGQLPAGVPADFSALERMTKQELERLGLRAWDETGLMLLPYQWYPHIPEGFVLHCIDGTVEPFKRGVTDDDYRFGVLAYGIVPNYARVQGP